MRRRVASRRKEEEEIVLIVRYILVIIEIITCFLLVTIILLQKTKAHGAGMAFGAAMGESLFGAQTGNILTKATVVLTIIFLLNTTILAVLNPRIGGSVTDTVPVRTRSSAMPQTARAPQTPANTMPNMPETPAATMPAPVVGATGPVVPADGAPGKADQPMQPDAAASLPAQPGEQSSK